jgi:NitT/TauT family transport system substrate-binding protein
MKQGFFGQEGLDVQLVPMNSGPELQAAVLGGAVSFAAISAITHFRAVQKNVPLKAVIAIDQGNPFYYAFSAAWVRQKAISGSSSADEIAAALKGARCAIAGPGGSTDVLTRVFLKKRNIDPDKDLSLVTIGADGMLAALENNRVDAFVNLAPDPLVAQTDGGLAWSLDQVPEFHGMLYTTMVTGQSMIQQNAVLVQGYVRALVNAWRFGQQNPDRARDIVKAASPGSDSEAFRLSYDSYVTLLKAGPQATAESYQKSLDVYRASGTDAVDLPMSQAWDTQFVEVAMKTS